MARADLAVGGGGVSTWERCTLGLPAIIWPLADNQRAVITAVAEYGAAYAPDPETIRGPEQLSKHVFALLNCAHLRRHLGARASLLCDGNGTKRIANLIAPSPVKLRPATIDDCDNVYRWRNHVETRRISVDSKVIPHQSHRAWFERALADPIRILLIAEQDASPVGLLRYDLDSDVAVVSIYLVPGLSGKGIGAQMLQSGEAVLLRNYPRVIRVRAVVLEANAASKAVFKKCGFSECSILYEKVLTR
jgi:RimJ/RimL family protein N-acetyltransferase